MEINLRNIRVMFQGGGARVVELLAAAEALERIEKETGVKVVMAGGVSAGAIAAAALAVHEDTKIVRSRLAVAGRDFLKKQEANLRKLTARPKVTSMRTLLLIRDIIQGNPILSRRRLRIALKDAFAPHVRISKFLMSNTRIPLVVFVSNLDHGNSEAISKAEEPLITAIERSVSLPFVFSTFDTGEETDGGVCGNLPISFFAQDQESDAKILAIHFAEEKNNLNDPLGYARALLSSAMNSSVREAIDQVEKLGGISYEMKNRGIGTFEFEKAVELADDELRYAKLVEELKKDLEKKIDRLFTQVTITKLSLRRLQEYPARRIHKSLVEEFPYHKTLSAQAQIHNQARPGPLIVKQSDRLISACQFVPSPENSHKMIRAIRHGLPYGEYPISLLDIKVRDRHRKELLFIPEIVSFRDKAGDINNQVLLVLEKGVSVADCPVKVSTSFDYPALTNLNDKKPEWSMSRRTEEMPFSLAPTRRFWIVVTPSAIKLKVNDVSKVSPELFEPDLVDRLKSVNNNWSHGTQLDKTKARPLFVEFFDDPVVDTANYVGYDVPAFSIGTHCGFFAAIEPGD